MSYPWQLCLAMCITFQACDQARERLARPAPPREPTPRRAPPNRTVSDADLVEAIQSAKTEAGSEAWGQRKVGAVLRHQRGLNVGHNRVWRTMGALGLLLPATGPHSLYAQEGTVAAPDSNRRWGADLTTVSTRQDGVVAVTPVIDFGHRSLLARGVSRSQESELLLAPVRTALHETFGTRERVVDGLPLRTDHGPQYTGSACQDRCRDGHLEPRFAPVGRPTGDAITQRVILTMKVECIGAQDGGSAEELRQALDAWRHKDNHRRPHESLGWMTPAPRRAENLLAAAEPAA